MEQGWDFAAVYSVVARQSSQMRSCCSHEQLSDHLKPSQKPHLLRRNKLLTSTVAIKAVTNKDLHACSTPRQRNLDGVDAPWASSRLIDFPRVCSPD
jgi:hypothetical protein